MGASDCGGVDAVIFGVGADEADIKQAMVCNSRRISEINQVSKALLTAKLVQKHETCSLLNNRVFVCSDNDLTHRGPYAKKLTYLSATHKVLAPRMEGL